MSRLPHRARRRPKRGLRGARTTWQRKIAREVKLPLPTPRYKHPSTYWTDLAVPEMMAEILPSLVMKRIAYLPSLDVMVR